MRLAVLNDYGTAMIGPDVEHHIRGTVATVVMAVDTMIIRIIELAIILVDGMNIPVSKVALVNSQLTVQLVSRLDESVA